MGHQMAVLAARANLDGEIDVAGRVDNVDVAVLP